MSDTTDTPAPAEAPTYSSILYEVDDPVAVITLNRPERLNAWIPAMDGEVRDAVARAVADPAVVGIIVTGAGRGFCAGADMAALDAAASADPAAAARGAGAGNGSGSPTAGADAPWVSDQGEFGGRFTYLLDVPKPVIAAVNGPVAGMAYSLALCCDLRFAAPEALFITAFAQRGLIAEWGMSWLLPRLVGPAAALDLLYSSRRVDADEAERLGLVSAVVRDGDVVEHCRAYVREIAARCSPSSLAIMKRQVNSEFQAGVGEAERRSQRLMAESFTRPDFREGVRSFIEKRPPAFARLGDGAATPPSV
ncbi:MAG: enoyl-CoA hydratase [Actinomyces sp.]|nr:MAG: enoyl-CoA hydratase [Actinomyces sp.]